MNQIETQLPHQFPLLSLFPSLICSTHTTTLSFFLQHSMVYFFHHYELPVIVQQAQLQHIFMRSGRTAARPAENGQAGAAAGTAGNQQANRENQQAPAEAPNAPVAPERPANNPNNLFVIRGTYRRRVNHLVERLRNNFYNNVFGVGMIADNNNNNANQLQNQPGFNNLTRSLRLLNMLFPNRPILNVRIINVRSASASATVADILRTAEGNQIPANPPASAEPAESAAPSVVRLVSPENRSESQPGPASSTTTSETAAAESDVGQAQHRTDGDVNNSVNVMETSTTGDGESSQTTSSSNEQC